MNRSTVSAPVRVGRLWQLGQISLEKMPVYTFGELLVVAISR